MTEALEKRSYFAATGVISFAAPVTVVTSLVPSAIVAGDWNKDGNQDLAVTQSSVLGNGSSVAISWGNGNGTFNAGPVLSVTGNPVAILSADFNGDGLPDLAVASDPSTPGASTTVTVFLNTGGGTFSTGIVTNIESNATTNEPIAFTEADFNGDGKADLAVTEYTQQALAILDGTGTGLFAAPVVYTGDAAPVGVAAGKFDLSTLPGLVLTDLATDPGTASQTKTLALLANDGSGDFSVVQNVSLGTSGDSSALAVADLTGAGAPDVVVGNDDGTVSILLNTGDTLELNATTSGTGASTAVAVGDFNLDGTPDVVSLNGQGTNGSSGSTVSVFTGTGGGAYSSSVDYPIGSGPTGLVVADFNNDGRPDLVTLNPVARTISILLNNTALAQLSTRTALAVDSATTAAGDAVTLTATVTPAAVSTLPGEYTATGNIDFYDGSTFLGEESVIGGTATLTTSSLTVGQHRLSAIYRGDTAYSSSTTAAVSETITPTSTQGPDLVVTLLTTNLPTISVPGELATVRMTIQNQGTTAAIGAITNGLYLSLDDTLDSGDLPVSVHGTFSNAGIHLQPEQSVVLTGIFTVPTNVPLASYSILGWANQTLALAESDSADNTAVATTSTTVVDEFGAVAGRRNVALPLTDSAGHTATVRLTGPGTATASIDDSGIDISLTGTTAASVLQLGATALNLHDLTADAPLGSIRGAGVTITSSIDLPAGVGSITLAGVSGATQPVINLGGAVAGAISLGAVANATLNTGAAVRSLTATDWIGGSISAGSIATLRVKQEMTAALTLSGASASGLTLGNAVVGSSVSQIWNISGGVGRLNVAAVSSGFSLQAAGALASLVVLGGDDGVVNAGSIGTVQIHGSLLGSITAAGNIRSATVLGDVTAAQIIAGDNGTAALGSLRVVGNITASLIGGGVAVNAGRAQIPSAATADGGGSIATVTVTGTVDTATRFIASTLPHRAVISGKAVQPGSDERFQS